MCKNVKTQVDNLKKTRSGRGWSPRSCLLPHRVSDTCPSFFVLFLVYQVQPRIKRKYVKEIQKADEIRIKAVAHSCCARAASRIFVARYVLGE